MNWMQIDTFLYGLINTSKSKDQLYQTAKAHFKWNDVQVESAVGPLLKRSGRVFDEVVEEPPAKPKRKRATTTKKKTDGQKKRVRKNKEV